MSIANVAKGLSMATGLGVGGAVVVKSTQWALQPGTNGEERPIVKPALVAAASLAGGLGVMALATRGSSTHAAVDAVASGAATLGFIVALGGMTLNGVGAVTNIVRSEYDDSTRRSASGHPGRGVPRP